MGKTGVRTDKILSNDWKRVVDLRNHLYIEVKIQIKVVTGEKLCVESLQ